MLRVRSLSALLLILVFSHAISAISNGNIVLDEEVAEYTPVAAPDGWNIKAHEEAHFMSTHRHTLTNITFAMRQHNLEYLEAFAIDCSDPASPK